MNRLPKWIDGNWSVPVVSGGLIVISFAIQWLGGGVANVAVGRQWWLDAGAHATHASAAFTLGDVFMLAAAVVAGYGIVVNAVRALTAKVIGIDLLVSIAAIGAVLVGNFWEAAAVTFLFAIGHALEAATLNKTRSALAELVAVAPDSAVVVRDGEQQEIPAGQVRMGEIVLVKNGAKVPVDGQVVSGTGALDEASITGESIPVEKTEGSQVFAGTVSRGGFLQVLAIGIGADTTLARIIHRVEEAQDAKAKTQAFIDRFSRWYTPAVMVLALVAGLVSGDVVLALTLLVIGCPGALVISIPVAIVAGIGRAARNGILIKGGEFLETSAKISAVAVDKTGTLTEGRPRLTDVAVLDPTLKRTEVLRWAAAAEAGSEHPLARPILETAHAEGVGPQGVPGTVTPVPGKGIVSEVDGRLVLVGNPPLLEQYGIVEAEVAEATRTAQDLAAEGKTPMIVAVDQTVIGVVAVADQIRQDAPEMVARLHRAGVEKVVMLTGGHPAGGRGHREGHRDRRDPRLPAARGQAGRGHPSAASGPHDRHGGRRGQRRPGPGHREHRRGDGRGRFGRGRGDCGYRAHGRQPAQAAGGHRSGQADRVGDATEHHDRSRHRGAAAGGSLCRRGDHVDRHARPRSLRAGGHRQRDASAAQHPRLHSHAEA